MLPRLVLARPICRLAVYRVPLAARRHYAAPGSPDLAHLMQSDPKLRDMLEKISRHPQAIAAMQKIGQVVQDKGFEPGKMPGKMELLKLMMDKEFREAAQNLTEEMQKAGVELDPQAMMKMMQSQ